MQEAHDKLQVRDEEGALQPNFVDAVNIDPAGASSVFVTTVTDIVGFFAFLGLAALWLG